MLDSVLAKVLEQTLSDDRWIGGIDEGERIGELIALNEVGVVVCEEWKGKDPERRFNH